MKKSTKIDKTNFFRDIFFEHKLPWYYKLPESVYNKSFLAKSIWLLKHKLKNTFSKKIRVGFFPLINKRYGIDPILNYINEHDSRYVADMFLEKDDLSKLDVIIIMRNFDKIDQMMINKLKENNSILVYNIIDNPGGCKKDYSKEHKFIESMDGVIVLNPLQAKDIRRYNPNLVYIDTPIISDVYKKDYNTKMEINIIWQGFIENRCFMDKLHPIIKKLNKDTEYRINLIYNTNTSDGDKGMIKYKRWKISDCDDLLINSDIAVSIKPKNDRIQQRKPATKIINYMAAGLPVVCTPSQADKLAIKHGETGFFAHTNQEWYMYLKKLIEYPELREKIGKAARESAVENYNIKKITEKHIEFFDELIKKRKNVQYTQSKT